MSEIKRVIQRDPKIMKARKFRGFPDAEWFMRFFIECGLDPHLTINPKGLVSISAHTSHNIIEIRSGEWLVWPENMMTNGAKNSLQVIPDGKYLATYQEINITPEGETP